jgi:hypothetical protein
MSFILQPSASIIPSPTPGNLGSTIVSNGASWVAAPLAAQAFVTQSQGLTRAPTQATDTDSFALI